MATRSINSLSNWYWWTGKIKWNHSTLLYSTLLTSPLLSIKKDVNLTCHSLETGEAVSLLHHHSYIWYVPGPGTTLISQGFAEVNLNTGNVGPTICSPTLLPLLQSQLLAQQLLQDWPILQTNDPILLTLWSVERCVRRWDKKRYYLPWQTSSWLLSLSCISL